LYFRVAKESPYGQGSVSMLEALLPGWRGKALVLILLGFAATGFVITITLSAADATAHIVQNPLCPAWLGNRIALTILMLSVLAGVFLKGFREAIGFSFLIVGFYLICNAVVVAVGLQEVFTHPQLIQNWSQNVLNQFHSVPLMIGLSLIYFPKLALGMSGFETGVAVMPLVQGDATDTMDHPAGRIRNTRKLLLTAALIMAGFLLCSGVITTLLIPPEQFQEGGEANGRALAYVAHKFLGEGWATVYDVSTILILWFAGASAIAGLLNLVPKYLPRYGMAPDWARAQRPLVLFIAFITFAVTFIFRADVDAQAGAYATGILVLFTSAALAVMLSTWNEGLVKRVTFATIFLIFVYTSIANMIERPEGLQISAFFIATILTVSLVSRTLRSLELRVHSVEFDQTAESFVEKILNNTGQICLLAHRPGGTDYAAKEAETRKVHKLTLEEAEFIFLEVGLKDPSEFAGDCLKVRGVEVDGHSVLRCECAAIPNAIAAILLHLRNKTKTIPHAYFGWTEGHPVGYVVKYIFLGEGETAPVTREILREVEPDCSRRPVVIVG
ncbi:MAG TPA: amino acid transporter, partial [Chroococcales cyanobacterium]